MLQNKRFHLGGCMHECSAELYDNFVVKPKQSLAQPIQIFCISLALCRFLMTFTQ